MVQFQQLAQTAYRWRYTTTFAAVGSLYLFREFRDLRRLKQHESLDTRGKEDAKKLVLTIPFDRLELVQQDSPRDNFFKTLAKLSRKKNGNNEQDTETLSVSGRELVHLIHTAASDPQICALFGKFGTGMNLGGERSWADWEEVRNALTVFSQSHRRHVEPNLQHQQVVIPRVEPKPLYCFADSFGAYSNPGNPQYYLASIFNKIHLQSHGELQLFGLLSTSFFLKGFLENYGVKLHVFKHGDYKTAPNAFTEKKYTSAHKETTANLVSEIDSSVCLDITTARSKALLTSWLKGGKAHLLNGKGSIFLSDQKILNLWQQIHDSGTFPAHTAWKAGLVDCLPRRNPLPDLLAYNQALKEGDEEAAKAIKSKWQPHETDFSQFSATRAISLQDYRSCVAKLDRIKGKREALRTSFEKLFGKGLTPNLLRGPGEAATLAPTRERIAYLDVVGSIDDDKARDIVSKLRALKESSQDDGTSPLPKVLVMRIVSPGGQIFACEQISQELRALDIPTVVSFGNVAASGGYYIAAHANRIFGLNKTLTGSIGVFGIRPDLTGLAEQYGICVDHVAAGTLAGSYSAFTPMTRPMQQNMAHSVDKWYLQFKDVVEQGRKLENVEELAQGKVWTGRQAKEVGLVDEIGGFERALSYAKRNFCKDPDQVEVVELGKRSFFSMLSKTFGDKDNAWQEVRELLFGMLSQAGEDKQEETASPWETSNVGQWLVSSAAANSGTLSGIYMTTDENAAIQALVKECRKQQKKQG